MPYIGGTPSKEGWGEMLSSKSENWPDFVKVPDPMNEQIGEKIQLNLNKAAPY